MRLVFCTIILFLFSSCELGVDTQTTLSAQTHKEGARLTSDCVDPDLSQVQSDVTFTMCDGSTATGTLELSPSDVRLGATVAGVVGTLEDAYDGTPDPWDIRYGVTVGQTVGKLKTNCREMASLPSFDSGYCSSSSHHTEAACLGALETWTPDGLGTVGVVDIWDVIDDANFFDPSTLPTQNPWSEGDEVFCGFSSPVDPNWERVITTPATSLSESVFVEKISGLNWTRGTATTTRTQANALTYCETTLNAENAGAGHGGISGWRLPTQKELSQVYARGIMELDDNHTTPDNLGNIGSFWSSTNGSDVLGNAFHVYLNDGFTFDQSKTNMNSVICVSP